MVDISVQLSEQKRKVDFKTYDISVKELISMVNDGIVNVSPKITSVSLDGMISVSQNLSNLFS